MSTLMLATLVDEGVLNWDTPAIDLWPQFLAPTPEFTANFRLRDLLGLGSGIAESPTIEFFMSDGTSSAVDLLHTMPYPPVIGRGVMAQHPFTLGRTGDLIPNINLTGFEPITWQSGLSDTTGSTRGTDR